MKQVILSIVILALSVPACIAAEDKARVVVMTDIGGDPDDFGSEVGPEGKIGVEGPSQVAVPGPICGVVDQAWKPDSGI